MGTVWMADQTEPVRRRVAVKLIRVERGQSRTILSRFEAERQAIALMDHPHIAKLLDAGTTADGAPFFVMELVKGVPLNDYCDDHKLGIRERLGLFIQICSAVQHAHQKGIIHRDLKPSNILVESHDDKPVPKVIDFGLAKATSGVQLSENTLFTAFGSVMGTPLYMAPEQANFNAVDVDTRADVYALGVILYELLTGTTPITRESMKRAAIDEMLRLIREQEAPTPSSRLSTSESTPSIAANRQMEPQRLGRYVRGELDWIVMKALSKERDRRYETAVGFARDIERFLNNEPVAAGPPSARYRMGKFVRRHRGQVVAASVVLLALLVGIAGTTWGLIRAERSAEAERQAKGRAERAADAEREANEQAQRRLAQIEAANAILGSIFENLDPKEIARNERPLQAILVEKLDQAVGQLEGESIGDPVVVAAMQIKFGSSLLGLGEPGKAIVLIEKALVTYRARLGPEHPETLNTMNSLARAYHEAGRRDLALPLFKETLELQKARFGPGHPHTLTTMSNLGVAYLDAGRRDLALPLLEETIQFQKARLGPEHPDTLTTMNYLAMAYGEAGRLDMALPLLEESLKIQKARLGPEHPETLITMNNLAVAYLQAGKLDLALPLTVETLKLLKARLGPDHPHTLMLMSNLAGAYSDAGKLDLALPLAEEAFKLSKARLGPEHPDTLVSMTTLAAAYWSAHRLDRSVPLFEEALKLMEKTLGRHHPKTLQTVANLGVNYAAAGRVTEALPLLEEAHRASRTIPPLRWVDAKLCDGYATAGRWAEAAALAREMLADARRSLPAGSPQLAGVLAQSGFALLQAKAFADAEPLLRECLAIREKAEPDAWTTFNMQSLLGGALLGQKKPGEAEPLLLKGYEGMKARAKSIPPAAITRIPEALDRLIELYTATNRPDDVKKWRAERAKYPASQALQGVK